MKRIVLLTLFSGIMIMPLACMEKEQSAFEQLPIEIKLEIVKNLTHAPSLDQAIANLRAAARVNKDLNAILSDASLTRGLIDQLIQKFEKNPKDANPLDYANKLGTPGAKQLSQLTKQGNQTALNWLIQNYPSQATILTLQAVFQNNNELANKLISNNAIASLIAKHKGLAELFMNAVKQGNVHFIKQLVNAGVPKSVQEEGLRTAAFENQTEIVKALLNLKTSINAQNPNGETALMSAVYGDSLESIELLLRAGAQTSLKNRQGKTALDLANTTAGQDIVTLLQQAEKK